MRPATRKRNLRPSSAALSALMLTLPPAGAALAATSAGAQAPLAPLQLTLDHTRVGYGGPITVTGRAARVMRGRTLLLQLAPGGGSVWQSVASAKVHTDGEFRLSGALTRSGTVRVVAADRAQIAQGSAPVLPPSRPRHVSVDSRLIPVRGWFRSGQRIAGTLLPRVAGRIVRLEMLSSRGWRTVGGGRTGTDGHFHLAYPSASGPARIIFAGDRFSAAGATPRRHLLSFHDDLASWYDDGGSTGCGFHATFGVANRDLPCGTQVTFRLGSRTVSATVDDRGPYVGGRDWDLNQNTAAALGFDGVGTVQVAY